MRSSLPDLMQVVEISRPGGPEVLKVTTRPLPRLKAGEVLIRVAAAGVNRPDCLQRAGAYPPPPGDSDLPGLEVAGSVVECAADVKQWQPGDQVCALTPGGGYAQYCATPAGHCLPLPRVGHRSRPLLCRRPRSRSGSMSSSVDDWLKARRCWCKAAPAASG